MVDRSEAVSSAHQPNARKNEYRVKTLLWRYLGSQWKSLCYLLLLLLASVALDLISPKRLRLLFFLDAPYKPLWYPSSISKRLQ